MTTLLSRAEDPEEEPVSEEGMARLEMDAFAHTELVVRADLVCHLLSFCHMWLSLSQSCGPFQDNALCNVTMLWCRFCGTFHDWFEVPMMHHYGIALLTLVFCQEWPHD